MQDAPLAIFLSPHFDDIALSCGGMAARLSRSGARCVCITVFTAPAPAGEPLSIFAQGLHTQWESAGGVGEQAINEVRREEERQALRLLGLQPVWLDLPDAPYRRSQGGEHFYTSDKMLFGVPSLEERHDLVPQIAAQIKRVAREFAPRSRVRVFAPLGVGNHVDHQLVFSAARRLGPRFGVLYYEDYPYAAKPDALQTRITGLRLPMQPRQTPISDLIGVKVAAIARYKSQLSVLFGDPGAMPAAVRAYNASPTGGYAERFWHVQSSYILRV